MALATAIMSATAITPPQDDKKTSKETVAAKEADTKTCNKEKSSCCKKDTKSCSTNEKASGKACCASKEKKTEVGSK